MAKPSKQIIIDAIIKEIEKGKGYKAVFGVIRSKSKLAESTFASYWKTANQQHAAKQATIKKKLAEVDEQAAIDARKTGLKSKLDRLMFYQNEIEVMEKQLRGEINSSFAVGSSLKKSHTRKIFMLPVQVQNQLREQIRAYQVEISKIEGDYAETAFRIKGDKDNPLYTAPNLSDSQFQQLLTAARESKTSSGQ